MNDLNRVQRIGHLGQDPEVTYTEQGTARTISSVATHHSDAAGEEWQSETAWHRCAAWGKLGERCPQYLHKCCDGCRAQPADNSKGSTVSRIGSTTLSPARHDEPTEHEACRTPAQICTEACEQDRPCGDDGLTPDEVRADGEWPVMQQHPRTTTVRNVATGRGRDRRRGR